MLKHYLPHLTFFIVFFSAAVPILYYIRRKNPNPRFRPGVGEMALMSLIAIFVCGGMAFGLGSLFKSENDGKSLTKKPGFDLPAQGGGPDAGSGKSSRDRDKGGDSDSGEPPRRSLHDRL